MTAMSTSDALPGQQPFLPPLSRNYSCDRIDIDDPFKIGYQIRSRVGCWLLATFLGMG